MTYDRRSLRACKRSSVHRGESFHAASGLGGFISFLVDTEADCTILMPADSNNFGIDFAQLANPSASEGIGGPAGGFNERAVLEFSDRRYIYCYLLQVEIAAPTNYNYGFPSLLGRDILDNGRLVVERRSNRLTFTPTGWSLHQRI